MTKTKKMKQKYLILANSITYDKKLEIYEADYTNSELSDEDISDELSDICATLEQAQLNTLILRKKDINKLMINLLSQENVNKNP
jgi:hypothetical protein